MSNYCIGLGVDSGLGFNGDMTWEAYPLNNISAYVNMPGPDTPANSSVKLMKSQATHFMVLHSVMPILEDSYLSYHYGQE